MRKWIDLKGWQKGSIIGFFVMGIMHVLFVTINLILENGRTITHPLGFLIFEWPLFILHSYVLESLFGNEYYPQFNGFFFWFYIYFFGSIGWGSVGVLPGLLLGVAVDLLKTSTGREKL